MWNAIKLETKKPLTRQLTDQVRDLIRSGRILPGERLPSYPKMAQAMGLPPSTVNDALRALAKEGLLDRRPRHGTFVRQREEKLTCVGIYYAEDIWARHSSDFQGAVHAALKEQLNRLGVQIQVWVDPRPKEQQAIPWDELCKAAEHRQIQALISVAGGWPHLGWQNKLPIPSAHLTSANIPNKVSTDLQQLAELGLRCLAKQGCRSVGLIMAFGPEGCNPDGSRHAFMDFYERFTDLAGDLGLTVRNEWMRLPMAEMAGGTKLLEQLGYEEFLKLWSQPEKPEGLFVFPDTTARGVILGLQTKQVRVPEDLKLVLHKNEECDLFCPLPATQLVISERACAQALIEQVQKQFRGERCEPIDVPFRLVAHRSEACRSVLGVASASASPRGRGETQRTPERT